MNNKLLCRSHCRIQLRPVGNANNKWLWATQKMMNSKKDAAQRELHKSRRFVDVQVNDCGIIIISWTPKQGNLEAKKSQDEMDRAHVRSRTQVMMQKALKGQSSLRDL